jgi:nucleoid DNA-binding protein
VSAACSVAGHLGRENLAAGLADSYGLVKRQAEAGRGGPLTPTTPHLRKGDKIRVIGLGILQVEKRAAKGRLPAGADESALGLWVRVAALVTPL